MGIWGLESYLLSSHPQACPRVRIEEMVEQFRYETGQPEAVAVIDTNLLLRQCMADQDPVSGGQFKEFKECLLRFVGRLEKLGITPVFFMDGPIEETKMRCWLDRKQQTLRRIELVYQSVHRGDNECPVPRESCVLPAGLYECAILTIKQAGYQVICAQAESDPEVARYGRLHRCFCIFSRDTDFVVLEGARHYMSLFYKHTRLSDMSTILFDREAIARSLGLLPLHLPLLASLLENDYVDSSYLLPLYSKLLGCRLEPLSRNILTRLVPALVQLIRTELWKASDPVTAILDRTYGGYPPFRLKALARQLGLKDQFEMRARLAQQLTASLTLYEYQPPQGEPRNTSPQPELDSDVDVDVLELARARHESLRFLNSSVVSLLTRRYLGIGPALEDPALPPACGSETALRPFRRRVYGLLQLPGPFTEWVVPACPPGTHLNPVTVHPICPDPVAVAHPGLLALWGGEEPCDDKWRLFAWALAAHQGPGERADTLAARLQALPPRLAAPLAVLYLLRHSGALAALPSALSLSVDDLVRLLVRTCLLVPLHSAAELRALPVLPYHRLGVHVAALFLRTYTYVTLLNDVVGAPIPLVDLNPELFFDGKLWHHVLRDVALDPSKVLDDATEKLFISTVIAVKEEHDVEE